jgi:hypothetical protein
LKVDSSERGNTASPSRRRQIGIESFNLVRIFEVFLVLDLSPHCSGATVARVLATSMVGSLEGAFLLSRVLLSTQPLAVARDFLATTARATLTN